MRIIIINLDRAAGRRQKMEAQFAAAGLPFEIMSAFDGCNVTASERALVDDKRRRATSAYVLSDNEIGCWLSHRKAMQQFIASGEPMAAIVEDDAKLSPDFVPVLAAIEKQTRPFDFIFLHRQFRKREIFVGLRNLIPGMDLGRVGYSHTGATAYVVSRKGAEHFIQSTERIVHAVDKEIHRYWANGYDVYGLERPIVVSDDGPSYIDETREKARTRYGDADTFFWQARRRLTQLSDSLVKRLVFGAYVRKGRRPA